MSEKPLNLPGNLNKLFSKELVKKLLDLRRDLHRYPELSFQEERTAKCLQQALTYVPLKQIRCVAGTGIMAVVPGTNPEAPKVALRGDMDALPVEEATGLEYASRNPGIMHACGHDVHATWTVGAAHLLAQNPAHGDVVILLQPAEEIGRGALAILDSGVLDGVSAIFGAHVDRRFEVGKVVAQEGALAASTDTFQIELQGKGAHGARPHEGHDPVVGAAALVMALQTIVARRVNPAQPAVVTVGKIEAGRAPNVIPEKATLDGTLRAMDEQTRNLLKSEVQKITQSIAATFNLRANIQFPEGTPALINPPEATEWARQAVIHVLGEEALTRLGYLNMAGEDFAYYLEKMPGCFLRIGAREPGGEIIPAHSPQFYAADESIFVGAAVLAEVARAASRVLSNS